MIPCDNPPKAQPPAPRRPEPQGQAGEGHSWLNFINLIFTGFFIAFLLAIPGSLWLENRDKKAAEALFQGPALGADGLFYQSGSDPAGRMWRLMTDIEQTRSPGSYAQAVEAWKRAVSKEPPLYPQAPWVAQIRDQERADATAWLLGAGVDPARLDRLSEKLEEISPALSKAETAELKTLANSLASLGQIQQRSLQAVFDRLIKLGASDIGLRRLGIRDPGKP